MRARGVVATVSAITSAGDFQSSICLREGWGGTVPMMQASHEVSTQPPRTRYQRATRGLRRYRNQSSSRSRGQEEAVGPGPAYTIADVTFGLEPRATTPVARYVREGRDQRLGPFRGAISRVFFAMNDHACSQFVRPSVRTAGGSSTEFDRRRRARWRRQDTEAKQSPNEARPRAAMRDEAPPSHHRTNRRCQLRRWSNQAPRGRRAPTRPRDPGRRTSHHRVGKGRLLPFWSPSVRYIISSQATVTSLHPSAEAVRVRRIAMHDEATSYAYVAPDVACVASIGLASVR